MPYWTGKIFFANRENISIIFKGLAGCNLLREELNKSGDELRFCYNSERYRSLMKRSLRY